jgi:drug/metabolite transporter (DMT)-like permease
MRIFKMVAGALLLVAGIAMLVLPGPGIATMVGGLWVLGDDVAWARRMRLRLTSLLADARARAGL